MKKRLFHRSYILENSSGAPDGWKTSINGHSVSGQLSLLKKSVDWWCDMKAFLPPSSFEGINSRQKEASSQQTEGYRGFKLINDSGKPNEWYVILRGQLLKGPADKIKKHLDMVIIKLNAQK
ncbi:DUF3319 domain-containing protein [Photobacterium profundum]|uniref:DUF3319 domain-containing protein n=1 Tax=Photobacterium profundum TaxID=74109 RepID=UPI003D103ABF